MNIDKLALDHWKAIIYLLALADEEAIETVAAIYGWDHDKMIARIRADIALEDQCREHAR